MSSIASVLIDLVGLAGFAALCAGVWLYHGLPLALIVAGLLMMGWAVKKSKVVSV